MIWLGFYNSERQALAEKSSEPWKNYIQLWYKEHLAYVILLFDKYKVGDDVLWFTQLEVLFAPAHRRATLCTASTTFYTDTTHILCMYGCKWASLLTTCIMPKHWLQMFKQYSFNEWFIKIQCPSFRQYCCSMLMTFIVPHWIPMLWLWFHCLKSKKRQNL